MIKNLNIINNFKVVFIQKIIGLTFCPRLFLIENSTLKKNILLKESSKKIKLGLESLTKTKLESLKKSKLESESIKKEILLSKPLKKDKFLSESIKTEILLSEPLKRSENKSKYYVHSKEVLDFIWGTLLGDSHLEKDKESGGVRLRLTQSKSHKDYFSYWWTFLSTRGYLSKKFPPITSWYNKNDKNTYYYYQASTYTFDSLSYLHSKRYLEGKKIVPKDIMSNMSLLGLALWFQEDGSNAKPGALLCTDAFSEKEVKFLSKGLNKKYNFKTSVQISNSGKCFRIYIPRESLLILRKLIGIFVVDKMKYKLKTS